jgi:molybdate transport system substrate-binding protein
MRAFIAAAMLLAAGPAPAAEINAMMTTAMKAAFDELLPPFERANGHTVRATYGPAGALLRRFNGGEPADLFITDVPALDGLIKQGKVAPDRLDLARTGIGIAVKKGAPKPDVSTPEALKRALLAAKTVGHAAPAGGSITAARIMLMFEKLGIAAEVAAKTKLAMGGPNGRVSVLVSSGEAEIGLQQASELLSNPDVEVIGMLPPEFQQITIYSAAIATGARQPDAAKAMIRHLATPEAKAIYKAKGLGLERRCLRPHPEERCAAPRLEGWGRPHGSRRTLRALLTMRPREFGVRSAYSGCPCSALPSFASGRPPCAPHECRHPRAARRCLPPRR